MADVIVLDKEGAKRVGDMIRSLQHFLGMTDVGNMIIKGLKRNPPENDYKVNKNVSDEVSVVHALGYIRGLINIEKIFDKPEIKKKRVR